MLKKAPQHGRIQRVRLLLDLFLVILLLGMGYAIWRFFSIVQTEKRSTAYYDDYASDIDTQRSERLNGASAAAPSAPVAEPHVSVPVPLKPEPEPSSVLDFSALATGCPDLVAWLTCDGTPINYPVVQGENNEYYLTHLPDGTVNKAGALFLDYRNTADFSDENSTIYGHRMKNGSMLAGIVEYKAQSFYDAHPVMLLYTPDGDYLVKLFAGFVAHDEDVYTASMFTSDAAYTAFITDSKAQSTFVSDVTPQAGERILTLVTCTYETQNARYVLLGRLTALE